MIYPDWQSSSQALSEVWHSAHKLRHFIVTRVSRSDSIRFRVIRSGNLLLLILLSLLGILTAGGTENTFLFHEDFQKPLGSKWQHVKFHEPTDYRTVADGSNACLMAFAKGHCSAYATKVNIPSQPDITCSWRWKIDQCPQGGSDDNIATFDHTARVLIVFDTWIGTPRSINYVWANTTQKNGTFDHPFSGRTKFIAVQTGNKNAGGWVTEQRDVQKDWSLLFGDEPMPKIVAVGVFTDSHSTKQPVKAWYRDLVIAKLPPKP